MILRIELWDFESHEHTVLEDISPALNLLCGESNSGKTSIIRALKLAAYNEFDPKSVRVGSTKCTVQVDTERGRVKVTRGEKHNLWEITKKGQATQYFDKVGTKIVPDAAEIMGLNIVKLGDIDVPVNIMDQLESHFMLAGIGDQKASGSIRAQIIDEISGLSGIEGLIKDVSLDHLRFGREIKEKEHDMEETRKQLHPEAVLNAEEGVLTLAEKELADHRTMTGLADEGDGLVSQGSSGRQGILLIERALSMIPDTDLALGEIERAEGKSRKANAAEDVRLEAQTASGRQEGVKKALAVIPDVQAAACLMNESETATRVLARAEDLHGRWTTGNQGVVTKQAREKVVLAALGAEKDLEAAQDAVTLMESAEDLLASAQRVVGLVEKMDRMIGTKDVELKAAESDRDDLLASIKTCPLTLRPVSKECLEGVAV